VIWRTAAWTVTCDLAVRHDRKRDQSSVKFSSNEPLYDVIRVTGLRFNVSLGKQIAIGIANCADNFMFDERGKSESKRSQRSLMYGLHSVHYFDARLEQFSGEPEERFAGCSQSSSGSITLKYDGSAQIGPHESGSLRR